MKTISKTGYVILKYADGYWITFWDQGQNRRIQSHGPYKLHASAIIDLEVLINKRK